jgi:hypothetical protein
MRRAHRAASQRKRRPWSTSTTRRPAIGKSAKRRRYRLWTRPEITPQDGHAQIALVARIVTMVLSLSLNALSAENPGGTSFEA